MKIENRKVYITSDGKEFLDESAAEAHERELKNIRFFYVEYGPDLTETGRRLKNGYIICKSRWSHDMWVENWLYGEFGNRVAFVQGVAPTWNWTYREVKVDEVDHSNIIATVVEGLKG